MDLGASNLQEKRRRGLQEYEWERHWSKQTRGKGLQADERRQGSTSKNLKATTVQLLDCTQAEHRLLSGTVGRDIRSQDRLWKPREGNQQQLWRGWLTHWAAKKALAVVGGQVGGMGPGWHCCEITQHWIWN